MPYQYKLLAPIDFSASNQATDSQATDVQRLKNAAYEDSPRGTFSFFAFYRPIIEQYVSEFARKNPFFPKEQKADLFWLTMRNAFALLKSYEHKGYGSFRNLLRNLVNYNALQAADRMVYMKEMPLDERDTNEQNFLNDVMMYAVLRKNPRFAKSKTIRDYVRPRRNGIPDGENPEEEALLEEFESEVEAMWDTFTAKSEGGRTIEALSPILGVEQTAKLVRWGAEATPEKLHADSIFGLIRETPEWFGLPADMFEEDGGGVAGVADAAQP